MDHGKIDELKYILEQDTLPIEDIPGDRIRSFLIKFLNLPSNTSGKDIVLSLWRVGKFIPGVAKPSSFDFAKLLKQENLPLPEYVICDFEYLGRVDRVPLIFFSDNFHDIWYPGADDMDVFDDQLRWVVSVSHDGDVKVVKLDEAVTE